MRYGFVMPFGDAKGAAELAAIAEQSGWDGFFVFEAIWGVDAWVALAAAAMRTDRIRLGTMLTPLPRRTPWEVASQAASVDQLSDGRVILSVGLGAPDDRWWIFEDDPGRPVRAERMDESLAMLQLLWGGESFEYEGRHYRARRTDVMIPDPPVQRPRIPIWVVGAWPRPRSMRRAARWDGWLPSYLPPATASPEHLAEAVEWIQAERGSLDAYDVVVEGTTSGPEAAEVVKPWREAGATWWLETDWGFTGDPMTYARDRLRAGPPGG